MQNSLKVPDGATVVIQTPHRPMWTVPGILMAGAAMVIAGALIGPQDGGTPTTPRDVVVAEASGAALYSEPRPESVKLLDLAFGQRVEVLCHTVGPESTGWGGAGTVWDKVKVDGKTGFVPDVSVNTRVSVQEIAPAC